MKLKKINRFYDPFRSIKTSSLKVGALFHKITFMCKKIKRIWKLHRIIVSCSILKSNTLIKFIYGLSGKMNIYDTSL